MLVALKNTMEINKCYRSVTSLLCPRETAFVVAVPKSGISLFLFSLELLKLDFPNIQFLLMVRGYSTIVKLMVLSSFSLVRSVQFSHSVMSDSL